MSSQMALYTVIQASNVNDQTKLESVSDDIMQKKCMWGWDSERGLCPIVLIVADVKEKKD